MKERDCKSCLFNAGDGCMSWNCEYINRDEAAAAYRRTRWVPASEGLPETTGAFLVTCRNGNVKVGHFTTFNNEWTDAKIVAWMSLPKAYRVQKAEAAKGADCAWKGAES